MSVTLSNILSRMMQSTNDFIEEDTTTNIAANTSVISTALNKWDRARDDYFNQWYIYITEGNNIGVERMLSDYTTLTGTCTVYGAALAAEAGAVTFWLSRNSRTDRLRAINSTLREIYPTIFDVKEDRSLISCNILPDGSFEDWTSTSALRWYTASNTTLLKTSTATVIRGARGTYSAKSSATAAGGYFYISSYTYPQLLDLMGHTVTFKAWAYPEVADDATLQIYTIKADGTTQTLSSTTAAPAGKWTLIELEDQSINDDIVEIQFRFITDTNAKYVYWDNSRVTGHQVHEYMIPATFTNGEITQVWRQIASERTEDPCDELYPQHWERIWDWKVITDGTYRFLQIDNYYPELYQYRLMGVAPFTSLSSDTDTLGLTDERTELVVCHAIFKMFEIQRSGVSADDRNLFEKEANYWYTRYLILKSGLRRMKPSNTLRVKDY